MGMPVSPHWGKWAPRFLLPLLVLIMTSFPLPAPVLARFPISHMHYLGGLFRGEPPVSPRRMAAGGHGLRPWTYFLMTIISHSAISRVIGFLDLAPEHRFAHVDFYGLKSAISDV